MAQMCTVHEASWDLLRDLGVRRVFGNPGSTELPFLNDMPEDIDYVLALQEASVVAMADAHAQSTGQATLVNLHTAAGLGNAMGALVNASAAHSPLVVTAGQQVRAMLTLEPLLANPDPTTLPRPAVKWSFEPPRAQDVPAALARAFFLASLPPAGPVFVSIPMDDWDQPVEAAALTGLGRRTIVGRTRPAEAGIRSLAARLAAAVSPVLVAGAGVDRSRGGFEAVTELSTRHNLPVWLAPNAHRVGFPTDHPNFRGSLPAGIGWASQALAGHDLIVVIGAPVFQYYPYVPGPYIPDGAELVAITDDPQAAARAPIGDAVLGDPAEALTDLLTLLPEPDARAAARKAATTRVAAGAGASETSEADNGGAPGPGEMSAGDVHEVLGELFPANGILVSETMNAAATMWRRVKFRQPGSFFFAAGGGLGFGLPGAVGAQLAQPERPVLCLTGDGGAQYGIQALWTAARYGIPVTILILDNQEYGILKGFGSFLRTDKVPGLNLGGLDYQAICAGYGVEVRRADDRAALSSALTRAFTDRRGPAVIVARIAAGGEDIGWHAE